MEREDKRGIFFGVIGVLTLIVAIIGASLAYFSINANSAEDAVIVQAATVQIEYLDGNKLLVANRIIPSTKEIAQETYGRYLAGEEHPGKNEDGEDTMVPYEECIDDNGYTVCGVYEFTLTNNGQESMIVTAKVTPSQLEDGEIEFKNLKYALYDVTNLPEGSDAMGTPVGPDGLITYDYENGFNITTNPISLAVNTPTKYRLFIWLDAQFDEGGNEIAQDYEQGAVFRGTIYVDVSGAEKITGDASDTLGN